MADHVILVDKKDNEIGTEEKILAHQKKLLHRAFSIFLFNDNLETVLKNNPHKWTIAFFHHPLYSATTKRDYPERRKRWKPLFDK